MKYKCLIVDDEELARNLIKRHLSQLEEFEVVGICGSAIEASRILQRDRVDLMFLDIEMPVLKGTELIRNLNSRPDVIFTTAYRDYAVEGFELNAVDYLLKPIVFGRFFKAIEKFLSLRAAKLPTVTAEPESIRMESIFIRKNRKQVKVYLDDILYIDSLKDYIQIHLAEEKHVIKQGITAFERELDDRFIRVHRSYIVNREKVTAFTRNDIEIGKVEIPVGESYKEVLDRLG